MNYYPATAISNKLDVAKTGAACVKILFKIDDAFNRRNIWSSLWLTDKAFDNSMKVLSDVFGWQGQSMTELNDPTRLAGIEVSLACEDEVYEGKIIEKVKFINKPKAPVDGRVTEKLQARLDAYRKNTPAAAPIAAAEDKDSGLPF